MTNQKLPQSRFTRRDFLRTAGAGAILLIAGCRSPAGGQPIAADSAFDLAAADTPALVVKQPREIEITPVEDFYEQQFQGIARVEQATWMFVIDGLVQRPITLSYEDILARPQTTLMRTLECIGNPVGGNQIGNAEWTGFWLDELLVEVGVQPDAVRARFEAADGYVTSVAREYIDRPGVLMAHAMNGAPLTEEHGFPLRIFMPGLYGQKMPKWITRVEFIADAGHRGYWEKKGWSEAATVKTNSQIVQPKHIARVPLSEVEVYGVAYAGDRRITAVEVGVQSGEEFAWYPAEILAGPSPEAWTQFYYLWTPDVSTSYTLLVRATDETGFTQTEEATGILEGAFPDGTDKIHDVVVKAG